MNKRGQGGSELRVHEEKALIMERREFANYLRENSGVKDHADVLWRLMMPVLLSWNNVKDDQTRHGKSHACLPR